MMALLRGWAARRRLIWVLAALDFRAQYLGSALGVLWSVLKPLVLVGLYALVFSLGFSPALSPGGKPLNFGLFFFAGMIPWAAVQETVSRSSNLFSDQSSLVRHHPVPSGVYPLALAVSTSMTAFSTLAVFVLVRLAAGGGFPWTAGLLVLFVLPAQVLLCCGLALLVSTLDVFVRDISHLAAVAMTVLFFASPLIFPPGVLSPRALDLMWLNPLTGFILAYRELLLFDRMPPPAAAASIFLATAAALAAGVFTSARLGRRVADRV